MLNIRDQFPILKQKIKNQSDLIYFDNAATNQKPQVVIDKISEYYSKTNSNIHRGVHHLSQVATTDYEESRDLIAQFINAKSVKEVIFTSGCTEGINLVATILDKANYLKIGDEIVVSGLEHHSNIVPWQMLCEATGAILKYVPVAQDGAIDWEQGLELITSKTKLVAITHLSNALGIIPPVDKYITKAKQNGALTLVDGAQWVAHYPLDVQALGADFYVFSGHKLYGPTGTGVLWGREDLLNELPPYKGGGEMIAEVTFAKTTYNVLPNKYEAGTPNISGGIALAQAVKFAQSLDWNAVANHEKELTQLALKGLQSLDNIELYTPGVVPNGLVSFNVKGVHHYDVGTLLDQFGIAVRTGHHCCQPLMQQLGITGTIRASFACYNTLEEVEVFIEKLKKSLLLLS